MLDNESYIKGINLNLLDDKLKNYIIESEKNLMVGCNKLILHHNKYEDDKEKYYALVFKRFTPDYIYNICLLYFVKISTFANSDHVEQVHLNKICTEVGEQIIINFLYRLKIEEKNKDRYSV